MYVRQSETGKKAGNKKTHTMLKAGVKGGKVHIDADRRAYCARKKQAPATKVVHYFVLQPSFF